MEFEDEKRLLLSIINYWNLLTFLGRFIGNALLIYIVLRYIRTRAPPYTYIANLAFSHLVLMSHDLLGSYQFFSGAHWAFGLQACKIFQMVPYVCSSANVLFILVLVIDRLVAATRGQTSSTPSTKRYLATVFVWLIALIHSVPWWFSGNIYTSYDLKTVPATVPHNIREQLEDHYRTEGCSWDNSKLVLWYDLQYFGVLSLALVLYILGMCSAACRRYTEDDISAGDGPYVTKFVFKILALLLLSHLGLRGSKLVHLVMPSIHGAGNTLHLRLLLAQGIFWNLDMVLKPILCFCLSPEFKRGLKKICGWRSESHCESHVEVSYSRREADGNTAV